MTPQSTGDPLGVIILERCSVEAMQHDTRPYSFTLSESSSGDTQIALMAMLIILCPVLLCTAAVFQEDASRTYILSAFSEPELRSWITAIQTARYTH